MKKKIICTIGPSSENRKVLKYFKKNNVDLYRINLSHTKFKDLEKKIIFLKKQIGINKICIDTEGAQIRTAKIKKNKFLKKNEIISIGFDEPVDYFLYPKFDLSKIKKYSKIMIGFNDLELKVIKSSSKIIKCKVTVSGLIETNKGVHFQSNTKLKVLTDKDINSIKLAKKLGVKNFALSFTNRASDVKKIRQMIEKNSFLISKIETKNALKNIHTIIKNSDAILIDRGDLSRYVPVYQIPNQQLKILRISKKLKKPTYIATNLLESMVTKPSPTRAESNDVFQCLYHGASGLVLAAETAIGKYPEKCVDFLKQSILEFNKTKY